jgi:hypothetical protein
MSKLNVRYCAGYNVSGTGQHEVLEYVEQARQHVVCRCMKPQHFVPQGPVEEGPYVVLYTETPWAAEAIAALLTADGGDNGFPLTPLATAYNRTASRTDPHLERYSGEIGDCPPGDLGNEVR